MIIYNRNTVVAEKPCYGTYAFLFPDASWCVIYFDQVYANGSEESFWNFF